MAHYPSASGSQSSLDRAPSVSRLLALGPPASNPAAFAAIDPDPFEDGLIAEGIAAHAAAGNSLESVVAFAVNERNYLRLQNGKLWQIIEKQKVIMEGLKSQIAELKEMYEKGTFLEGLREEDEDFRSAVGSRRTSMFRDESGAGVIVIPSISEIRKSLGDAVALNLPAESHGDAPKGTGTGKRRSLFESTVPDQQ
ncbi:hypothetical protein BC830DRAFT_1087355, partial [Chytriomyces sp. MP71]